MIVTFHKPTEAKSPRIGPTVSRQALNLSEWVRILTVQIFSATPPKIFFNEKIFSEFSRISYTKLPNAKKFFPPGDFSRMESLLVSHALTGSRPGLLGAS